MSPVPLNDTTTYTHVSSTANLLPLEIEASEGDSLLPRSRLARVKDGMRSGARKLFSPVRLAKYPIHKLSEALQKAHYFDVQFGVSTKRWWFLFVFCFASFNNGLISLSYSSLPSETIAHYPGVTIAQIQLIIFLSTLIPALGMFPVVYVLTREGGLNLCTQLGAVLVFAGSLVRYLPDLFYGPDLATNGNTTVVLACLHLGNVLNSAAFPFFMAPPPQISVVWFPAQYRTTVTAVAVASCEVGFAFAFFICGFTDDIRLVVEYEFYLCFLGLLTAVTISWIPNRPEANPNLASVVEQNTATPSVAAEVQACISNRDFLLLAISGGVVAGCWTSWCPLIPNVLVPYFTERTADKLSLYANTATIIGGIGIGPIADKWFHGRFKTLLIGLLSIVIFSAGVFTMVLPHPDVPDGHTLGIFSPFVRDTEEFFDEGLARVGTHELFVLVVITGLAQGAIVPICYELCADMTFPMTSAGGIYQFCVAAAQVLFMLVPPFLPAVWFTAVMYMAVVSALLGVLLVDPDYRRLELVDDRAKFLTEAKHDAEQKDQAA